MVGNKEKINILNEEIVQLRNTVEQMQRVLESQEEQLNQFRLKQHDFEVSGPRIVSIPEEPCYTFTLAIPGLTNAQEEYYNGDQILNAHVHTNYHATCEFSNEYINESHAKLAGSAATGKLNWDIEGWLRPAEALKLYEMVWFSKGDILQLGTFKGLSTDIIVQALTDCDKGHPRRVLDTVDVDAGTTLQAKESISNKRGTLDTVQFHICDGTEFMDQQIVRKKKYGFIFIDHCHWYRQTYTAALRVSRLLSPGGFVLFHDYKEHVNFDPHHDYAVFQAVNDALMPDERFEYCGVFGSASLFYYTGE